jgi:hypothetical protein
MREGVEDISWFQFHQAVKAHFAIVMGIIKGLREPILKLLVA